MIIYLEVKQQDRAMTSPTFKVFEKLWISMEISKHSQEEISTTILELDYLWNRRIDTNSTAPNSGIANGLYVDLGLLV